jgi:hypothetical protein
MPHWRWRVIVRRSAELAGTGHHQGLRHDRLDFNQFRQDLQAPPRYTPTPIRRKAQQLLEQQAVTTGNCAQDRDQADEQQNPM